MPVELNGNHLSPEELLRVALHHETATLCAASLDRVRAGRKIVDDIVQSGQVKYGINTGFGKFADVVIPADQVEVLQENLIRSHASGVGEMLPVERVRALLTLRINVLLKGHSGVAVETLLTLVDMLNKNCVSYVPSQGTVGASGDLAPLAHLALGAMGEGKMWDPQAQCWGPAAVIMKANGIRPVRLRAKEGLALINGTQFITSLAAEALVRAERIAKQADAIVALTLEALRGSPVAMDPRIHRARGQNGQIESAKRIRSLLLDAGGKPSEICDSHKNCGKVQDAYSLRCAPQVHGVVHDTLAFVRELLDREINAATDNPMIFTPEFLSGGLADAERAENFYSFSESVVSGGNFHGEYPAKAADMLAIAVSELASISERRIERLLNHDLSGLPAFLVPHGGLNSGFMISHCAAAALVSENKVLVHPSSCDTIPTSAGQEDHVSMGGFAARKALDVVQNVEQVLAVELIVACQALDILRPLRTTEPLESIHRWVRETLGVAFLDKDRYLAEDLATVAAGLRSGALLQLLGWSS